MTILTCFNAIGMLMVTYPGQVYRKLWHTTVLVLLLSPLACTQRVPAAKDGQVCFHRRPFANPVKPQRCTTEPVRSLDGINKDVGGAKLLLTTTSVYPVHCACICPLLKTQHHCLCPNGRCNLPLASHPPPPPPPPSHPPNPLYTPFLILQSL